MRIVQSAAWAGSADRCYPDETFEVSKTSKVWAALVVGSVMTRLCACHHASSRLRGGLTSEAGWLRSTSRRPETSDGL